jgi:hypothetical protein
VKGGTSYGHGHRLIVAAALCLAGCSQTTLTMPAATGLPVWSPGTVDGQQVLCGGTGITPMRVQINVGQAPPVWAIDIETGHRFEVIWPYGFELRPAAQPELVDGQGKVVARAGDIIREWGGGLQGNTISLCSVDRYPAAP